MLGDRKYTGNLKKIISSCWEPHIIFSPGSESPSQGIQAVFPLPSMARILGIPGHVPALFDALSVREFLDNPCPE